MPQRGANQVYIYMSESVRTAIQDRTGTLHNAAGLAGCPTWTCRIDRRMENVEGSFAGRFQIKPESVREPDPDRRKAYTGWSDSVTSVGTRFRLLYLVVPFDAGQA